MSKSILNPVEKCLTLLSFRYLYSWLEKALSAQFEDQSGNSTIWLVTCLKYLSLKWLLSDRSTIWLVTCLKYLSLDWLLSESSTNWLVTWVKSLSLDWFLSERSTIWMVICLKFLSLDWLLYESSAIWLVSQKTDLILTNTRGAFSDWFYVFFPILI